MKTLAVIPTYNERDSLPRLVQAILALPERIDLLVVDDNSPDGTGQLADGLAQNHPDRIFTIHRAGKLGLGSAYIEGFRWGLERGYEAVCEMDADGSHLPADLPRLVAAVRDGADLAIGSRRVAGGRILGWNAWRHLMSWGAMTVARLALGLKTKDVTAGFRCYRSPLVAKILEAKPASGGYAFQEETLFICERSGAKIKEIPVVFHDREIGGSKLGRKEIIEFFSVIFRIARTRNRNREGQPNP